MHVFFISSYPSKNDGVSDYTHDLVQSLQTLGVKFTTAKIDYPFSLKAFTEWSYLLSQVVASKADLVHIQYTPTSIGWRVKWFVRQLKKKHIPVVLTVHEKPDFFIDKLPRLLVRSYLLWERSVYQAATALIVHTADQFVDIRIRYDIPGERISTFPHYIQDTPATGQADYPRLVVLGRLVPKKRLDLVLDALEKLHPTFPKLRLLVIGEAPVRYTEFAQNLKNIAKKSGLESVITWSGYVNEQQLPALLSPQDIGILPYLMATQSGAAFKLLSHNIPLLTNNLPAFLELMAHYPVGQAVPLRNGDEVAAAISNILKHPELQITWQQSIQCLKKDQSLGTIAQLHLKLYTSLCQNTSV